jgi:hypothetical protein
VPDPAVDPTPQPPTIAVDLHTELTATVAVIELGNGAVTWRSATTSPAFA